MPEIQGTSPSERIREYLVTHPELTRNDNPEQPVKLENPKLFREKLVTSVKGSTDKYFKIDGPESATIENVIVDDLIPLSLEIYKSFKYTPQGKLINSMLNFIIKKPGENNNVAEFALRDYGNKFRLSHRYVDPKYRGDNNRIADSAIEAIEEFVKEYARKMPDREPIIEANAAQLDAFSWFSRNGFETTDEPIPVHEGEKPVKSHALESILNSIEMKDGKYEVGPYLYVFPSAFNGPRVLTEGVGVDGVNRDEAARVNFRKKLQIEDERISEVIKNLRDTLGVD